MKYEIFEPIDFQYIADRNQKILYVSCRTNPVEYVNNKRCAL